MLKEAAWHNLDFLSHARMMAACSDKALSPVSHTLHQQHSPNPGIPRGLLWDLHCHKNKRIKDMNKPGATKDRFLNAAVERMSKEKGKSISSYIQSCLDHWLCTSAFLSNQSIISTGMLFIWERCLFKVLLTFCTSKVNVDQFPTHSSFLCRCQRNPLEHLLGRRGKNQNLWDKKRCFHTS